MSDVEPLRAHADRIKASGVLGRSPLMQRLVRFPARMLDRRQGTEGNRSSRRRLRQRRGIRRVAGRDGPRLHHKLRRKLEEFYAGPGSAEPVRLSIPKGEYRFVVEAAETTAVDESLVAAVPPPPPPRKKWLLPALAASLLVNARNRRVPSAPPLPPMWTSSRPCARAPCGRPIS